MNSKTPGTGSRSYTKTSLILDFLHGSIHFFVISILSAMVVTGLDMVSPQLIRTTVDSVLGSNELKLPAFLMNLVDSIGGVPYLRSHLWLIGIMIAVLALLSASFR